MLDRAKLIKEIEHISNKLFVSYANEYSIAQKTWQRIARDVTFVHKLKSATVPWALPTWEGELDATFPVPAVSSYQALSVDGSQIYPDRHQGTGCFLINVGSVGITYGSATGQVFMQTRPYVFGGDEMVGTELAPSPELVNCVRQEYELAAGVQLFEAVQAPDAMSRVLLFDGSLIFWHLSGADTACKTVFLPRYIEIIEQLHAHNRLCAWYVSLPKSKDLVNLVRCALCEFDAEHNDAHKLVDHVVDAAIVQSYVAPRQCTTVFKAQHALCKEYPEHLQPHFFYLHVGDEIGRVEVPAYIARDKQAVAAVAACILDQSLKGRGYPVVLSEAHEQAVVKGPDRDFFYQVIAKHGIEHKQRTHLSQKSLKKRGLGI